MATAVTASSVRAGRSHEFCAREVSVPVPSVPVMNRALAAMTQFQCIARCTPIITSSASDDTSCITDQKRSRGLGNPSEGSADSEITMPDTITTTIAR